MCVCVRVLDFWGLSVLFSITVHHGKNQVWQTKITLWSAYCGYLV